MHVYVCMWVCAPECRCSRKTEEGVKASKTIVVGDCEIPTWVQWELNPDLLQEKQALLTDEPFSPS